MDDLVLVRRFQRGEEAAFDILVDRHRRRVYSLAARLASPSEADDLAQEIFIAAYKALPRYRGDAAFTTWLYRVAVYCCSHYIRRRRMDVAELNDELPDSTERHDPEHSALAGELQARVREAISALPYKAREVIVLRDLHGLSYEEIAQVVGCPIGTVRSRLHYATHRLEQMLRTYVESV